MTTLDARSTIDPTGVGSMVDALLHTFFDQQEKSAASPELSQFIKLLREMIAAGGKRVRPILCVTGWNAVSPDLPPPIVFSVAASLELFHAFALIHDDIMDNSETRRGRPTAHRIFSSIHSDHPAPLAIGVNSAILLGDLALGWSYDILLGTAVISRNQPAVPWEILNTMRTETLIGQYLDLVSMDSLAPDIEIAWKVIRYKTAKYTFERPLQLGARLAGANNDQLDALSAYSIPLGEAFQLRDDLLGVFGNPATTGKSALDDLREGKITVLVATAYRLATPAEARRLDAHLGNPRLDDKGADECRDIFTSTGAAASVERMITERLAKAMDSLENGPLRPSIIPVLRALASVAANRVE